MVQEACTDRYHNMRRWMNTDQALPVLIVEILLNMKFYGLMLRCSSSYKCRECLFKDRNSHVACCNMLLYNRDIGDYHTSVKLVPNESMSIIFWDMDLHPIYKMIVMLASIWYQKDFGWNCFLSEIWPLLIKILAEILVKNWYAREFLRRKYQETL